MVLNFERIPHYCYYSSYLPKFLQSVILIVEKNTFKEKIINSKHPKVDLITHWLSSAEAF